MKTFSNKTNRRKYFLNILAINIPLLVLISILVLLLPNSISAKDDEEIEINNIVEAEKYLNNYRNLSLNNYSEKEELVLEKDYTITYNTNCNYYMFSGYYSYYERITQRVWNHGIDLYRKGLIHGSDPYQCTFFAQMWFYDVYGFNSTGIFPSGNGGDLAYRVYEINTYYDENGEYRHYFTLDTKPKTGAIVSVTGISNPYGHAMVVDKYDEETNMITFSDGNVTNNSDIRIRVTMSLDEFYYQNPGYYVYANPTDELWELIRNKD